MSTPRINYNPPFTQYVIEQNTLSSHPFGLIDIGASGGIEQHWQIFGSSLVAFGFEPLIAETERLNATKGSEKIVYICSKVTGPRFEKKENLKKNNPFPRTSAMRAMDERSIDYVQSVFDPTGTGTMTEDEITIDQFLSKRLQVDVDFIKIDTDGHDYFALCGAEDTLSRSPVLGVCIESQFHGPADDHVNLFSNIDRFLRARGFSLFDIEVYRYSRAALPKPFVYNLTAQTHGGQVLWGDALYVRDLGDPYDEGMWKTNLTPHKIIKLGCLFEIYGLEDCTAELLCSKRKHIEQLIDVDHCLNLLTPRLKGKKMTFEEYNARFEHHVEDWFPKVGGRRISQIMREGRIWGVLKRMIKALETRIHARISMTLRSVASFLVRVFPNCFLKRIGPRLARIRSLDWYPGWSFGSSESAGGVLCRLRYLLWLVCAAKQCEVSFPIEWYDGLRVQVHLGNDLSLCVYVAGNFEPNEFMLLGEILQPGMIYIDVGANDGLYTLFASKRVGSSGRVFALEPSSREMGRLKDNLQLNRIDNVQVLQVAASDRNGLGSLRVAGFRHEGHNTLGGFAYDIEEQKVETVDLLTLDSLASHELLERVDVIKIDAEGAELAVLRGSQEILKTYRPVIQFELLEAALSHQDIGREEVCAFLRSLGYSFYIFGPLGRPLLVERIEIDGVNVVAVHSESKDIISLLARCAETELVKVE